MNKDFLFAEEVKSILVDMVVEGEMDSDMTQLDIQSVFNKAKENLKSNEMYIRECRIEKLGKYTSFDTHEELVEMYNILDNLDSTHDNEIVDYVDGIQMAHAFEYDFTVISLWETITD